MIRRYGGQRSLFEAALGVDTVEALIDPTLRRLDAVLADEHLVDTVFQRQAGRFPRVAIGTPRDAGRCRPAATGPPTPPRLDV